MSLKCSRSAHNRCDLRCCRRTDGVSTAEVAFDEDLAAAGSPGAERLTGHDELRDNHGERQEPTGWRAAA